VLFPIPTSSAIFSPRLRKDSIEKGDFHSPQTCSDASDGVKAWFVTLVKESFRHAASVNTSFDLPKLINKADLNGLFQLFFQ